MGCGCASKKKAAEEAAAKQAAAEKRRAELKVQRQKAEASTS